MSPQSESPPGTTWFLRDRGELEALVAALVRDRPPARRVRLWSVGCSTGQEPYGLAMALLDAGLLPQVLATDIRPEALSVAQAGCYSARAVSVLPTAWLQRYTVPGKAGEVVMHPAVLSCLRFVLHDIASSDDAPLAWGPFDAVVCRNVLIYFERDTAVALVGRLLAACRPDGYLLLSAAERPLAWQCGRVREDADFKDSVLLRPAPADRDPALASSPSLSPISSLSVPPVPASGSSLRRSGAEGWSLAAELAEAASLLHRGEFAAALARLDAVIARDATVAQAYLLRGLALKHSGRPHEAAAALRGARYLSADEAWMAPYQLGLVLEGLGQPVEAGEAYRHALAVLRAGGRSGLPAGWPAEEVLPATLIEACQARLRALGLRGQP